jgi:hypothetical protein
VTDQLPLFSHPRRCQCDACIRKLCEDIAARENVDVESVQREVAILRADKYSGWNSGRKTAAKKERPTS